VENQRDPKNPLLVSRPATSPSKATQPSSPPGPAAVVGPAVVPPTAGDGREEPAAVQEMSTVEIIKHITTEVGHLARKEIELAKTELKADLKAEAMMVGGLSVAVVAGLCTLTLLLVTVVFALATVMPGWLAGLIVSGVTLIATGVTAGLAWSKRVRKPLARTQRTLKDDVQWTREHLS
jgi:hypothetical protein